MAQPTKYVLVKQRTVTIVAPDQDILCLFHWDADVTNKTTNIKFRAVAKGSGGSYTIRIAQEDDTTVQFLTMSRTEFGVVTATIGSLPTGNYQITARAQSEGTIITIGSVELIMDDS